MTSVDTAHRCDLRHDDNSIWSLLKNWWLLPAHFIASVILTLMLTFNVNNHRFLVSDSDVSRPSFAALYQSDVTTLLSVGVVLVRALAGSWLALVGWRMAFILLEHDGATLGALCRTIRYRIPPTRTTEASPQGRGPLLRLSSMWLLYILATPSQFIAPMLTGAISWIPAHRPAVQVLINITQPSPNLGWFWHNNSPNSRFYEVQKAAGLASFASSDSFNTSRHPFSRRHIPTLLGSPLNSTIDQVTIPYFKVESLQWIRSRDDLSDDEFNLLDQVATNFYYPALNVSRAWNPFWQGTDAGRLTIANNVPWEAAPQNASGKPAFPAPSVDRGTKFVAVATQFGARCSPETVPFGLLNGVYQLDGTSSTDYETGVETGTAGCYIFARMNYSAGTLTCRDCPIVLDGVVQGSANTTDSWKLEPDPLVEQAIAMMPEVLFYTKIANISSAPSWNNLDGYTIGMLTVAYQASWNSLANVWSDGQTTPALLTTYAGVLIASVTLWRVVGWFAVNALLTVSGALLAILQSQSRAKTVRNPELSALLLDTSKVTRGDDSGLCNAVELNKADSELRLRLIPARPTAPYQHPFLEVEERRSHVLEVHEVPSRSGSGDGARMELLSSPTV